MAQAGQPKVKRWSTTYTGRLGAEWTLQSLTVDIAYGSVVENWLCTASAPDPASGAPPPGGAPPPAGGEPGGAPPLGGSTPGGSTCVVDEMPKKRQRLGSSPLAAVDSGSSTPKPADGQNAFFYCKPCDIWLNGRSQLETHNTGQRHKKHARTWEKLHEKLGEDP